RGAVVRARWKGARGLRTLMASRAPWTRLSAAEVAAVQQYARFYQAHCLEIETRAREAVERSPDWARVFEQLGGSQLWSPASDELMMQAIFEGRWEPFLATLRAQGEHFARAGATYSAWFDVFRAYRN